MANSADSMIVSRRKRMKFDNLIRIQVGPEEDQRSFSVHAACLTSRSSFSKNALSKKLEEAEERTIKFPQDKADTVELYLHCVYGQPLPIKPSPCPEDYVGHEERLRLAKLYVTWKFYNGNWSYPDASTIRVIYSGTTPGSNLRKLVVDINAYAITSKFLEPQSFPHEFLGELVTKLTQTRLNNAFCWAHLKRGDGAGKYLESVSDSD